MKNYYSSGWFEKTIFFPLLQKLMMLAIFLLMVVSSVFADHALPVYHSPYSSRYYNTQDYPTKKRVPALVDYPLPVYHSPYRSVRNATTPTYSSTFAVTYPSEANTSASVFAGTDYTQRKPFEETDVSMLSPTTKPMRAPAEDDPPFPGDPGQMPVGDGLGFLLLAAAGYALMKRKSFNK